MRANEVEPDGYGELLSRLKERMRAGRVRASRAANTELMRLYWSIGRDILDRQEAAGWGTKVSTGSWRTCGRSSPTSRAGLGGTWST
nr:DUF1016 N-terminal domain-containing protein [Cellulosimicrobium sp. TH-20]